MDGGGVAFTRFGTSEGTLRQPTARYDFAVELGGEEGRWRLVEQVEAVRSGRTLSDHLYVLVEQDLPVVRTGEMRTKAVARGGNRLAAAVRKELSGRTDVARALAAAASEAWAKGGSRVAAVTETLVQLGREAERVAQREAQGVRKEGLASAGANIRDWTARLELARHAARQGVDALQELEAAKGLFHVRAGLRRVAFRASKSGRIGRRVGRGHTIRTTPGTQG